MKWSARRKAFRAILAGDTCHFPISVYDPMTARMAQNMGFEVSMLAGSVAAMAIAGVPDWVLISATEFVALANRIGEAGNLPLIVDADHGYGNPLNVRRTVAELDTAGIAALTLEDTVLPTPYGEVGQVRLTSIEEGVAKMRAGLDGRDDPDLAVIGRTSAIRIAGVEDAIARALAYQAAGVDAIAFIGVRTAEELDAVAEAIRLPIMLGGLAAELSDRDELSRRGVRISLTGHQPFLASVQAAHDTMRQIRDGARPSALPGVAGADLLAEATALAAHLARQKAFMGG